MLIEICNWDMVEMKGGSYCTCEFVAQSQWQEGHLPASVQKTVNQLTTEARERERERRKGKT